MKFVGEVEGPLFLGAMMVAFVEVYDTEGDLFNPPGVRIDVTTVEGNSLAVLRPGDKGVGKCEFAPLMGRTAKYIFHAFDVDSGMPLSDPVVCDLGLPYVGDTKAGEVGQLHKSFYVRFREQADEPPPIEPEDECHEAMIAIQRLMVVTGENGVEVANALAAASEALIEATNALTKMNVNIAAAKEIAEGIIDGSA